MPKLSQTTQVTGTTTEEVELKPAVRRRLKQELEAILEVEAELDRFNAIYDQHLAKIEKIREEAGVRSLKIDGFTITRVGGDTTKLDVKKLLELGVSKADIDEATTTKPKREHTRVTAPGKTAREDY